MSSLRLPIPRVVPAGRLRSEDHPVSNRRRPASDALPVSASAARKQRRFPRPDRFSAPRPVSFPSPRLPQGAPCEARRGLAALFAEIRLSPSIQGLSRTETRSAVRSPGSWRFVPRLHPGPVGAAWPRLAGRDSLQANCRSPPILPPLALAPVVRLGQGHSTAFSKGRNRPCFAVILPPIFPPRSPPLTPRFSTDTPRLRHRPQTFLFRRPTILRALL